MDGLLVKVQVVAHQVSLLLGRPIQPMVALLEVLGLIQLVALVVHLVLVTLAGLEVVIRVV